MARTWLRIRVELLGGSGIVCDPPAARIFFVGLSHTFDQLAEAINTAFARWDPGHLHLFALPDGRLIGFPDDDEESDTEWLDHAKLKVAAEVKPGAEFGYVFDLGEDWRHRCQVEEDKADPLVEYGVVPKRPVAIEGWGWIPDQYGRESYGDEDDAEALEREIAEIASDQRDLREKEEVSRHLEDITEHD